MKSKLKKILLVLFIVLPALFFSLLLILNKEDIGFSKKFVIESNYVVEGMTCLSCANTIKSTLKDVKYVVDAKVDYEIRIFI